MLSPISILSYFISFTVLCTLIKLTRTFLSKTEEPALMLITCILTAHVKFMQQCSISLLHLWKRFYSRLPEEQGPRQVFHQLNKKSKLRLVQGKHNLRVGDPKGMVQGGSGFTTSISYLTNSSQTSIEAKSNTNHSNEFGNQTKSNIFCNCEFDYRSKRTKSNAIKLKFCSDSIF